MNKILNSVLVFLGLMAGCDAPLYAYPPAPAPQYMVNAGSQPYLYVTPQTLQGYLQPGVSPNVGGMTVANTAIPTIQLGGSLPFNYQWWQAITQYPNLNSGAVGNNLTGFCLTNCPYIAIYRGLPTNIFMFGSFNGITGNALSNQTSEIRFKVGFYGNQIGFLTGDNNAQYAWRVDNSAWAITNVGNAGNNVFWTFNLANQPALAPHTFEFDVGAANGAGLCGVFVPLTNAFMNVQQPTLLAVAMGDSFTDGAAGIGGTQLWISELQDLLEPYGYNVIPMGEGGTGYTTVGATTGGTFTYRLTNYIVKMFPNLNMMIWAGGINDIPNVSTLYANATNAYGLCKYWLPNCKQIAIGPWSDQTPADGASVPVSASISNACTFYGLPVIYPQYSLLSSWMTGYWNTPASGNAPLFCSGNGPHPNLAGHQFLTGMIYPFVLQNGLTSNGTNMLLNNAP